MTGGKGKFARAVEIATEIGQAERREGEGTVLHSYPDYETYRRVQEEGNKTKLTAQFVNKDHIFFLADHLKERLGHVGFGLCHGVRRGREQKWFRRRLGGGADVIGTEISETASQFPETVQWDFHDTNPDWAGRADFVYSNSWDHAFDPHRAFRAWADALRPGGLMLLDHTAEHEPRSANALDPFGATFEALERTLDEACGGLGARAGMLDRRDGPGYRCRVLVFVRNAEQVAFDG